MAKKIDKKNFKKLAYSFQDDLKKDLKNKKFKEVFYQEKIKLDIANEIIRLRKKKKISQKELAKKIKTTQAVISRIENGQVFPSTNIIQRICNELNVRAMIRFC